MPPTTPQEDTTMNRIELKKSAQSRGWIDVYVDGLLLKSFPAIQKAKSYVEYLNAYVLCH